MGREKRDELCSVIMFITRVDCVSPLEFSPVISGKRYSEVVLSSYIPFGLLNFFSRSLSVVRLLSYFITEII